MRRFSALLLVVVAAFFCSAVLSSPASALTAPVAVSATSASSTSIVVAWSQVSGATGYTVSYGTTSAATGATSSVSSGSTLSTTISGLSSGTTYYFIVAATPSGTYSSPSVSAVPGSTLLANPRPVVCRPSSGQVIVSWGLVSGATGYIVYRGLSASTTQPFASVSSTTQSYTDASVANNTTYYYRVAAFNSSGCGTQSAAVSATPPGTGVVGPPQDILYQNGSGDVDVYWEAVSGASSYCIYRSTVSSSDCASTPVPYASATSQQYVDTTVASGSTYWYCVTAVDAAGEGPKSVVIQVTAGSPRGQAPSNLAARSGTSVIHLTWTVPSGSPSPDGYAIYRSQDGSSFALYAEPSGTSYDDSAVTNGTIEYYRLAAIYSGVASSYLSANATPVASTTLTGTVSNTPAVNLSWTQSAGATGYSIYKSSSTPVSTTGTPYATTSSATAITYTDSSVSSGQAYYYCVVATNASGASTPSNTVTEQVPSSSPINLVATPGDAQVVLTWTAPAGGQGVTGYNVYRGTSAGGEGSSPVNGNSPVTATSYTDTGLTDGTTYYYEVTALSPGGESARSNEASATPAHATPMVATAATASPDPVSGTTTALSVLGADSAGESTLTYTWSASGGPANVTYSGATNGTNAAKNITATFTAAGTYNFTVQIADPYNDAVPSSVSVVVNQTAAISVSPSSATVATGGAQQFSASEIDQFGAAFTPQPTFTWAATSGSISSAGLFTAPNTTGSGTVTATSGSVQGSASFAIATGSALPQVSALTMSPSVVIGGNTNGTQSTGTVTLNAVAPYGGLSVLLTSSNTSVATVPSAVTVPQGSSSTTFTVTTSVVTTTTLVTISASSGTNNNQSATLTVQPWLLSVSPKLNPVVGPYTTTGTITLNGGAPAGGLPVTVACNPSGVITTSPSTVIVPAGASTATFTINAQAVPQTSSATITATYGQQSVTCSLTDNPILASLSFSPASVLGGNNSTGTVRLNEQAPTGGISVSLQSKSSAATVPATINVAAGNATATFTATTTGVSAVTTANVIASVQQNNCSANLTINPIGVQSLSFNPASVVMGNSSTGTVTLNSQAPSGGLLVSLSSSISSFASCPPSVMVAAGSTSATFPVTTTGTSGSELPINFTAAANGVSATGSLGVINLIKGVSVKFPPNYYNVVGYATNGVGTVTLQQNAPTDETVTLTSYTPSVVSVPTSVTVPAGQSSVQFAATGGSVGNTTIDAHFSGWDVVTGVQILPLVNTFTLSPSSVYGGQSSTGTITFNAPPPSGATATVTSSSSSVTVPSTINIAGQTSVSFPISTTSVSAAVNATITITITTTIGNYAPTAQLTVNPAKITLSLSPMQLLPSGTSTGTVTLLSAAPQGGATVSLTSSNTSAITVPTSFSIGAGQTSGTFTATGQAVTSSQNSTITASYNGASANQSITIAPLLSSVSASPSNVVGGDSSSGLVTLSMPAPSATTVTLTSSNTSALSVPASVSVSSTSRTAPFTVTTYAVAHTTSVVITASAAGISVTTTVTIQPQPTFASFVVSPTSVIGGSTAIGTVTLSGVAPTAGVTVNLASSVAGVTVPSSFVIPSGYTQGTFTINTQPTVSSITSTITATYGSQKTAQLSVAPPVLTGFSLSQNQLVGGSSSVVGTLQLNGPAPAGGVVVNVAAIPANAISLPTSGSITIPANSSSVQFPIATSTVNQTAVVTLTATNMTISGQTPLTATLTLSVGQLHLSDLLMPKAIVLQWNLSAVGSFEITRIDSSDNNATAVVVAGSLPNNKTTYTDTFSWVSGHVYTYSIFDTNQNPPVLLSTEQVQPYLVPTSADQAVDSRIDPRYGDSNPPTYQDWEFGATSYKGGLFVGNAGDNSQVGHSFAQFNLAQANDYPASGAFLRAAKVNAYFVTTDNSSSQAVNMSVGCQAISSPGWDPATLTWTSAKTAFTSFNPSAAIQIVPISYNPLAPSSVAATAGNGQVTLSWQAPPAGSVLTYTVAFGTTNSYYLPSTVTGIVPSTSSSSPTSVTITGLTNGTTYYFAVEPVNANAQITAQSALLASTPGNPPSVVTTTTAPTIGYWCSWPLVTDILNALTNSQMLNIGWASMSESNPGWAYFAKTEYSSSLGPCITHAWSLPTLVSITLPSQASNGGSATGQLTVNAIGLTGSAIVNLSLVSGNASGISFQPQVTVTGLNTTFPISISQSGSYRLSASYSFNGGPTQTVTSGVMAVN